MKYLLDTDHLSILQRQSGSEYDALCANLAQRPPSDIALCSVSFHEQVLGCNTYIKRAKNASDVVRGYGMLERLLSDFAAALVLPFDLRAAFVYDGLEVQRVRIGTMDLRIASVALSQVLILVTRNSQDFNRVPGLVIEDWTI